MDDSPENEETFQGAKNRCLACFENSPPRGGEETFLYVGLESGLYRLYEGDWYEKCICYALFSYPEEPHIVMESHRRTMESETNSEKSAQGSTTEEAEDVEQKPRGQRRQLTICAGSEEYPLPEVFQVGLNLGIKHRDIYREVTERRKRQTAIHVKSCEKDTFALYTNFEKMRRDSFEQSFGNVILKLKNFNS